MKFIVIFCLQLANEREGLDRFATFIHIRLVIKNIFELLSLMPVVNSYIEIYLLLYHFIAIRNIVIRHQQQLKFILFYHIQLKRVI